MISVAVYSVPTVPVASFAAEIHHKAVFLALVSVRAAEDVANGAGLTGLPTHFFRIKNSVSHLAPCITSFLYETASPNFLNCLHTFAHLIFTR